MSDLVLILDIGTTTISGAVLNRDSGFVLASDYILNGQIRFGDDIISRIEFSLKKKENVALLQKAVVSSINRLIKKLLASAGIDNKDIKEAFCVCNAAIYHLILGIDASPLITPPYRPKQKSQVSVDADKIGLRLKKGSPLTFLPNIEGFVGSDALAVIISSGIYKSSEPKLAIDIGTNGEVILGNKDNIFVASTAAGPAFEGRHISCGMPAISGAIEEVKIKKTIDYKVIGDGDPKGICGSGLIDLVYQMLKTGIVDRSGRMKRPRFVIYKKGQKELFITQQDIRRLQLAKAAISASVKVLLRKSKIFEKNIKKVLITGSFGNRLNIASIAGIGLVPPIDKKKVIFLRKGALEGLRLYLTRRGLREDISYILGKTRHIPLLGRGFSEEFTSAIGFEKA